jgi:hypothetical protein
MITRPLKGSYLRVCPTCTRRRRCWRDRIPGDRHQWICSQGHTWIVLMGTLERVNAITKAVVLPGLLDRLLSPSPLLGYLKRR